MNYYKAPWSKSLIVISCLATTLCFGIAIILVQRSYGRFQWYALFPPALILGSALFTIRGYTVTADSIQIHRLFWKTALPLAGLQSAEFVPKAMRWSIRTFGNGGLFSFTGFFRNKLLGAYRAFVTDTEKTVVLRYPGRTIVLSPSMPDEFIRALPISARTV